MNYQWHRISALHFIARTERSKLVQTKKKITSIVLVVITRLNFSILTVRKLFSLHVTAITKKNASTSGNVILDTN